MKKILTLIISTMMCLCLFGCSKSNEDNSNTSDIEKIKKAGVLRVGMECDYVPFNWMVTNETATSAPIQSGGYADGYDVYFSKMIAEKLGVDVEVVKVEWDGLTLALESGTIDLIIAGMSPTEQRKMTVDFTDAYYGGDKVVIVRKDSKYVNGKSLADLTGAKLAHQHNNVFDVLLKQIPECNIINAYDSTPRMLEATIAGEIDGFVDEIDVAISAENTNSNLTYVKFDEGKGFDISETVDAIACRKGSDLKDFINDILVNVSNEEREALMDKANASSPVSE